LIRAGSALADAGESVPWAGEMFVEWNNTP
jgi:hypothetical protein